MAEKLSPERQEFINKLQKTVDDNSRTVSIINKVVYVAVAAAIGTYVTHVWM